MQGFLQVCRKSRNMLNKGNNVEKFVQSGDDVMREQRNSIRVKKKRSKSMGYRQKWCAPATNLLPQGVDPPPKGGNTPVTICGKKKGIC
jgi:hypothetical protein